MRAVTLTLTLTHASTSCPPPNRSDAPALTTRSHTTRSHHPPSPPDNTTRQHHPTTQASPYITRFVQRLSLKIPSPSMCALARVCACVRARACVRACVRVYISRLWLHRSTPTRSTEGPRSSIPPASPNSSTVMMRWSNTCIDTSTALSSRHSAPTSPHQSTATRSPLSVRRASTTPSATPRISRMRHPP